MEKNYPPSIIWTEPAYSPMLQHLEKNYVKGKKKVYFTHQTMWVGTHHLQPVKIDFFTLELSKT
jgi:hypothetical protein